MRELKSMSDAVKVVIDGYETGHEFYGNELKDDVVRIYPEAEHCYPDTILKMARRHRRKSYICIDRNNSLYKKVAVKSVVEQIKELIPKKEIRQAASAPVQWSLFSEDVSCFLCK